MVVAWFTKQYFSDNACQGVGEDIMLSLTAVWVKHPIQIRNKDYTTNFCWANSSSNGKCPVGELEGEGALLGCRYVKSKQEITTLSFSCKITKINALKSIILLTSQSTCRTVSVTSHSEKLGCSEEQRMRFVFPLQSCWSPCMNLTTTDRPGSHWVPCSAPCRDTDFAGTCGLDIEWSPFLGLPA